MSHISEVLSDNFEIPVHKVSERYWNRFNQVDEPYVMNQAEIDYWEKVSNLTELVLTNAQQKIAFNESYKHVLRVGERMSEQEYIQTTKNDPEIISLINKLIDWYFKNENSKKGGFLIYSPPGVGKTSTIKALNHVAKRFENKTNMGKIEYYDLNKLIRDSNLGIKVDLGFYINENIIIDDLSQKVNFVTTYGNKSDMNDIFENRYNVWQSTGACTIIATNLLPFKSEGVTTLADLITERSMDRIKQQYEIILLTGESKRK